MGRHSAPASPPASDPFGQATPDAARRPGPLGPTRPGSRFPETAPPDSPPADPVPERLVRTVLALAAGVATLLATSWAGLPWRDAAISGVAAAAIVVVAAWIAGTMPQRPTPYSDARDSDHPRE